MRILLVASKFLPEYTGAAVRIQRLYRLLLGEHPGWSVQVLCGGVEQVDAASYEIDYLSVRRIRSHSASASGRCLRIISFYREFFSTWQILSQTRFDLIHTIGNSAVTSAAIHYAQWKGKPLLVELVNYGAVPNQELPLVQKFWRLGVRRRTAIVAISDKLGQRCRSLGYDVNVWVRPNPVDTERFTPEPGGKHDYRQRLTAFSDDDIVIAMIAKFMPQKNQRFLLDVLNLLNSRYKLLMAGPLVETGPLAQRDQAYMFALRESIDSLGLVDRVQLVTGFVDAANYMKAADVYVMPNLMEGLGTPLLEALACGLPVVANAGEHAFKDYLPEGRAGFLVPLEASAWAAAIEKTLRLDRGQLATVAVEIAERYSLTRFTVDYQTVINGLMACDREQVLDIQALMTLATKGDAIDGRGSSADK